MLDEGAGAGVKYGAIFSGAEKWNIVWGFYRLQIVELGLALVDSPGAARKDVTDGIVVAT